MAAERPVLNRLEVLRALRISNWEAVFSTAHLTLTTGAFQTGFALWLGAGSFYMGLLGAVPTLAGLIQVPASYFVERLGERKRFSAWFAGAGRLLWAPILLIPYTLSGDARLTALLALVLLSGLLVNAAAPAFTSWLSDLVPPDSRGRYFGQRNMLAGLATMVISLPAAWFLDLATKRHLLPEEAGFAGLFGVAALCGAVSLALVLRQAEPPMHVPEEPAPAGLRGLLEFYRTPLSEPHFRRFLSYLLVFSAGQFFAAPFYTVYALEVLRLDYVWLQILMTLSSLASMLSMPLWGYLTDKFGARPLLTIAAFGVALLPLGWVLTSPRSMVFSLVIICLNNLAGGCFWAGVGLIQFNLLIGITPSERKTVYVGLASAATAVAGGLAPVAGGALLTALLGTGFTVAGWEIGPYHLLFLANSAIRFLALWRLRSVPAPGAATPRDVLAQIGSSRVSSWRHIRRLQRPASETGRVEAAHALGSARASLAVDELIAALDDPSMHVREEAAAALGEIGDPRAVEPLLDRLDDPASGIVDESLEALGRIGDPAAVPGIAAVLADPSSPYRVHAARALGRIGTPECVGPLLRALEAAGSADVAEAVAVALGRVGDPAAVPTLLERLERAGRAETLAILRALGAIGDRRAAPRLMALLESGTDQAVATHAAVALAMMEATEALEPLLNALDRVDSRIARRQVLHAAGTLMGGGEEFYALLSADGFARDEAVARILRGLGRSAEAAPGFGARRRPRELERVLERYLAGDLKAAASHLVRLASASGGGGDPGCVAVLQWAQKRASTGSLTADEFLLTLFAARALLEPPEAAPAAKRTRTPS